MAACESVFECIGVCVCVFECVYVCVLLYYVCVFEQISLHFETFARKTSQQQPQHYEQMPTAEVHSEAPHFPSLTLPLSVYFLPPQIEIAFVHSANFEVVIAI